MGDKVISYRGMILCIGATPALQRVMVFKDVRIGGVNRAAETLDGIAGKSINVAKVLKKLGEEPLAVGFIGGDRGEELKRELARRGIQARFVAVPESMRQCITVIDEAAGKQTELVEESKALQKSCYAALLRIIRDQAPGCRAMIMSGTLTPGAPEDFYLKCAEVGRAVGILVVVDAKSAALIKALEAKPDVVKPNRAELEATFAKVLKDEKALKRVMRELFDKGARNVVVTAGAKALLAFDGTHFWKITPPAMRAVNPIGSGDAFTAGLAWRLLKGDGLGEACLWAASCGAANALSLMPGELKMEDVRRLARLVTVGRSG